MLVKYSVQEIPGRGRGIVAEEFIPKGTKIWEFQPDRAIIFKTKDELDSYLKSCTPEEQTEALVHIFCSGNEAILLLDDTQYTNHDENANTCNSENLKENFASRDIFPGEEMTDNYKEFHVIDWFEDLCRKYNIISCVTFPVILETAGEKQE